MPRKKIIPVEIPIKNINQTYIDLDINKIYIDLDILIKNILT